MSPLRRALVLNLLIEGSTGVAALLLPVNIVTTFMFGEPRATPV